MRSRPSQTSVTASSRNGQGATVTRVGSPSRAASVWPAALFSAGDAVDERKREPVPREDQLAVLLHRLGRGVRPVARVAAEGVEHAGLEVALALEVVGQRALDVLVAAGREALDEERPVQRDEQRRVARLRQQQSRGARPELEPAQARERRERVRQARLRVPLRASAPRRSRRCRAGRRRGRPPPAARTAPPRRARSARRPRRARAGRRRSSLRGSGGGASQDSAGRGWCRPARPGRTCRRAGSPGAR